MKHLKFFRKSIRPPGQGGRHAQRGVASIPIVLVLLVLTIAIGLEITSIVVTQNLASQGQDRSSQAFRYAETGARDALVRIARDKAYTCDTSDDCYTIEFTTNGCTLNTGCVRVQVSAGTGNPVGPDPKIIIAEGQVRNAIRKVRIDVVYDGALDGEIASTTWRELTN